MKKKQEEDNEKDDLTFIMEKSQGHSIGYKMKIVKHHFITEFWLLTYQEAVEDSDKKVASFTEFKRFIEYYNFLNAADLPF